MSQQRKKGEPAKLKKGKDQPPKRKMALHAAWNQEIQSWELVHPRCARDRAEDIEEVEAMVAAGEFDVAMDELRWLLNDCPDFIDAHRLLGELAIEEEDWPLSRGHLGYCFDIAKAAMNAAGAEGPLSNELPANAGLLSATFSFAGVLCRLEKVEMARTVLQQLMKWDQCNALGAREAMSVLERPSSVQTPAGELPLVELFPPKKRAEGTDEPS